MVTKEITWKKLSSLWIPEKKDEEISGRLAKVDVGVGENKSMLYTIETEDAVRGVWGSTVLDGKMRFFEVGDYVKIVFLGKKEGGKKESYKDFEVFFGRIKNQES